MTGDNTSNNPLLEEWTAPHGMPPFHAIRDEHFMPAFESAMRLHLAEVEADRKKPRTSHLCEYDRSLGTCGPRTR